MVVRLLLLLVVAWPAWTQPADQGPVTIDGPTFARPDRGMSADVQPAGAPCGTPAPRLADERLRVVPADCSFSFTNPDPSYAPGPLYRIPVVVHVIQDGSGTGYLSDAQVQSQITVLNEDVNALAGTPGAPGTDAQIEFFLANTDPSGGPTTGIERITNDAYFTEPYPGTGFKTALHWDTSRYFNIYSQVPDSYQGYATFPQQSAGAPDDGVVLLYRVVGRPAIGPPPFDRGRTGTHEVGHYLGLFHTFEGGCAAPSPPDCYTFPGDVICDTFPERSSQMGCPIGATSCNADPDPIDNYMDYTDDTCRDKFTNEQMLRMRCVLTSYRSTLITGDLYLAGQGYGQPNENRVRVFRGDGTAAPVSFLAYGAGQWGVGVAGGNVTGGPLGQMVTGPGPGAVYGPHVRGFQATGSPMAKISYFAYGTLRYGVDAATAELDADGFDEIVSGTGPGAVFGPHVRGWSYDNVSVAALSKVSYFAYGSLQWGVNVSSGDLDGDGYAEMLTGPGPGSTFGPQVRGWNYDDLSVMSIGKINFLAFGLVQYGVNVAGGDVEADRFDEIGAAPGPGAGAGFAPRMKGFNYDGAGISALLGFDVTVSATTSYGGQVALGDMTGDGRAELLAGQGRDPAADATVMPYLYQGGRLTPLPTFDPFPGSRFGVNVSSGHLGN